jgi:subtilisin-like proprotein convertase family protein
VRRPGPDGPWRWYSLTGGGTTIQLTTCTGFGGSASYDTKISVYCQGCDLAGQVCVAANDDGPAANCPAFQSSVTFCGQAGGSFLVLVHGFGAGTGNFSLNAIDTGVACTPTVDCLPPVPEGSCCTLATPPFEQGEAVVDCFVGTSEECAAAGGVYGGDNTECTAVVATYDYVVNPNLAIPDNVPAGVNSTINVTDAIVVEDVNVDIGITHTWVSDLIVTVTSPGATSQVLWNRVCGATDNINATADDSGTETFCAPLAAGPIDSVFYPPALAGDGPLAVFNGENALGIWTFNVSDNYPADIGTINQWSLHFTDFDGVCADFSCPTVEPPTDCGDHGDHGSHGDHDDNEETDDEENDDEDDEEEDEGNHHWWGVTYEMGDATAQTGTTSSFGQNSHNNGTQGTRPVLRPGSGR